MTVWLLSKQHTPQVSTQTPWYAFHDEFGMSGSSKHDKVTPRHTFPMQIVNRGGEN